MSPRAWVLNLRSDEELATSPGTPEAAQAAATQAPAPHEERWKQVLVRTLCAPEDVVLPCALEDPTAYQGDCWCPTPSALQVLRDAGVPVPPAPPVEVLRLVNDRAFALPMVPEPWRGVLVGSEAELKEALDEVGGGSWLLQTRFGFAGRGQRRGHGRHLDENAKGWVKRRLAAGGLVLEPWKHLDDEFARHGVLEQDGAVRWGRPVRQRTDARGAWLATEPLEEGVLSEPEQAAWQEVLDAVARALHGAGYFGPFGVDAWRTKEGFNPLSDLNARYTMGFAVGMGTVEESRA